MKDFTEREVDLSKIVNHATVRAAGDYLAENLTERQITILRNAVGHWLDEMKNDALFGVKITSEEIKEIEELYDLLFPEE